MLTEHKPVLRTIQGSPFRTLDEFLFQHGPKAQLFQIDSSRMTTIVGEQGARLTILPDSFSDINGKFVDGPVEIHLKEVISRAEMILADKTATSEDRILESAGQLWVQATQGNGLLQLRRPMVVDLPVRKNLRNPLAMRLFVGSTPTVKAFHSDKDFDWKLWSDKPVAIRKVNGHKYYHFNLERLNWANCDYFVSRRGGKSMVTVKPENPVETMDKQIAFLAFEDINSVARMYPGIHGFTALNIPNQLSATAVVIGMHQGQLFFGHHFFSRFSDRLAHVRMRAVTDQELLETLHRL